MEVDESTSNGVDQLSVLYALQDLHVGGINRTTLRAAEVLIDRGVTVNVAHVVGRTDMAEEFRKIGAPPFNLGHRGVLFTPRTHFRALQLLRRLRPDIVHANTWFDEFCFGPACKLLRIPLVTSVHALMTKGPQPSSGDLPQPRGRKRAMQGLLRKSQRTWNVKNIAVSESVKESFIEYAGVPPEHVEVLKTGIDFATSDDPGLREKIRFQLGIPVRAPVLINVGRLMPSKNQGLLISATEQLLVDFPDLHLVLVGDGQDRERIEHRIKQSSAVDRVHVLGNRADVSELLGAADIFLTASVLEGLPTVVLEACAAGLPVVAGEIGPVREILTHGETGILCNTGDATAFASAVRSLMADSGYRNRLGNAGRAHVTTEFGQQRYISRLIALYRSVKQGRKAVPVPGIE